MIFDVDGTLIDSVDYHAITWHNALEYYGVKANLSDVRMQIGKAGDQLLPVFATNEQIKKYGEEIKARKTKLFHENYFHQVKPFPGVRQLFELIKQRNIPIALASSAVSDELEVYKKIANVGDLVDCQTSSNSKDVKRSKPYPGRNQTLVSFLHRFRFLLDIFLAALKLLKNPPTNRVIVVGDTPWDAQGRTMLTFELKLLLYSSCCCG